MKVHAQPIRVGDYAVEPAAFTTRSSAPADLSQWCEVVDRQELHASSRRQPARGIGWMLVLAFSQSLLFLAFWLYFCTSAGAETPAAAGDDPKLQVSSYSPSKTRDPFVKAGAGAGVGTQLTGVDSNMFHLQGILYQPTDPSAIVNNKLVSLNKIVTLTTDAGEIQIKAVEITRDRVVMEAGGQKVELRLIPPGAAP